MSRAGQHRVTAIDEWRWRVEQSGGMRTHGLVFADRDMMVELRGDPAIDQVANVAHLPGIVGPSIAMPDIHWGYGFPIGGVAAFDLDGGVVSPGGVGYDINCGVRLLATPLIEADVRPKMSRLLELLYDAVPSGLGSARSDTSLSQADLDGVMLGGAEWAVERGLGRAEDLTAIEAFGKLSGADPVAVSDKARKRGRKQLGTLGSGNHFLEVQYVADRYDERAADALGLPAGAVTLMIHSGSRG
ncbi:MAG: RtcB family protein, partial [Anaerolineae bacterium]